MRAFPRSSSSLGASVNFTSIRSLIFRSFPLTGQLMSVDGFGIIIGFESGVMAGTQKLGKSFALVPDMFDRLAPLVEGLLPDKPSPFSVAISIVQYYFGLKLMFLLVILPINFSTWLRCAAAFSSFLSFSSRLFCFSYSFCCLMISFFLAR